jgi:hypothetical protein
MHGLNITLLFLQAQTDIKNSNPTGENKPHPEASAGPGSWRNKAKAEMATYGVGFTGQKKL